MRGEDICSDMADVVCRLYACIINICRALSVQVLELYAFTNVCVMYRQSQSRLMKYCKKTQLFFGTPQRVLHQLLCSRDAHSLAEYREIR